jgi:hypothetical protein
MFLKRFLPILFSLIALQAKAAAPAGETWFTLQTPNFRLHHTKLLEAYARAFGKSLERALPLLEKDLRWKVETPIDVVLMDPSDSANGFAANFPNTHIQAYAVPFETDSALGHYVDWVDELATHELTHIIANDSTRGAYKFLRSIFGSWVKPNGLQPTWLIEGLAVFEETRFSTGGRGRSPLLEALLREATWQNKLNSPDYLSLDRFNDGAPWWPGGNTAYLLGYAIQAQAQFGAEESIPGALSLANSSRFPFSPNGNAENITGRNWPMIWNEAVMRLRSRYGNPPLVQERCKLTNSGRFTGGHAISQDGWIYFSEEDHEEGFHLARVRADAACAEAKAERLVARYFEAPTQVAVSPNGKLVAYVESDFDGKNRFVGTLHLYDVEKKSTEEQEGSDRGHTPAFLDDQTLLFVKNLGDSKQAIVKREISTGKEQEIFQGKNFERISGLYSTNTQIFFALHDNAGSEAIHWLDLKTGKLSSLPPPANLKLPRYERNPSLSANGELLLFAASYGGGAQELYAFDFRSKTRKILNRSANGFMDRPILFGNKIIAMEYGLGGMNLVRVEEKSLAPAITQKEDLYEFLTGKKAEPAPTLESKEFPATQAYDLWNTTATSALPQYWIPEISAAENGVLIGASTGGNDALGYHAYSGLLQYDSRAKFPIYRIFYVNRQNTTSFRFDVSQTNDYFLSTKSSNRKVLYSATATLPIGKLNYSFGPAFQERHVFQTKGQSFTFFHNLSYDRVSKKPAALSANRGLYANLYLGLVPTSRNDSFFVDTRPTLATYFEGFRPVDSISFSGKVGLSTNRLLVSNYYLGGGVSTLSPSDYVVRGYPVDALLGQRIATFNLAYTLSLGSPYRGWGTNPLFLRSYGLRFHGDIGSASFVSRYSGTRFLGYQGQSLAKQNLIGTGIDLVGIGSIAYHLPIQATLGLHYGLQKKYGGQATLHFGLNLGAFGNIGAN